jgi:dephospho-CoA kinase
LTKSGKSTLAQLVQGTLGGTVFELSQFLRDNGVFTSSLTTPTLIATVIDARQQFGPDVFARNVVARIASELPLVAIVAGIRSDKDEACLREAFGSRYCLVFVHSSRGVRYARVRADARSLKMTIDGLGLLDVQAISEGIGMVCAAADFMVVNGDEFPRSLLEQAEEIVARARLVLSSEG